LGLRETGFLSNLGNPAANRVQKTLRVLHGSK
jgi:hypothetical protein